MHRTRAGSLAPLPRTAAEEGCRNTCAPSRPGQRSVAPPTAKLPDHPAYQQIMAVFAEADAPLRAREVCEAMDVEIAPNNVNNVRLKLERPVERGIPAETEQGLFTRPRP